jgi:MoxR-like ATPase
MKENQLFPAKQMIAVPITLEQLITVVQQLPKNDREQVVKALIEVELQSDLTALIKELYSETPIEEITDLDIIKEIKAVRQQISN